MIFPPPLLPAATTWRPPPLFGQPAMNPFFGAYQWDNASESSMCGGPALPCGGYTWCVLRERHTSAVQED